MQLCLLDIGLRLDRGANLHFFHGPALYAWLLDRMGNPRDFPAPVRLWPVECGRVRYLAGSNYRFGMVLCGQEAVGQWQQWLEVLTRPPRTKFGHTDGAPFGAGIVLQDVRCGISGQPVTRSQGPQAWSWQDLAEASQSLVGAKILTLEFASPLRILRTPVDSKEFVHDGQVFDAGALLDRANRAVTEYGGPGLSITGWPAARVTDNRMLRTDVSYTRKRIGAARGKLTLALEDALDLAQATALQLAGVVGVGQASNMGLGRFVLGGAPLSPFWPPKPAQTLCERAAAEHCLVAARHGIMDGGAATGVDDVDKAAFLDALTFRQNGLAEQLATATVEPSPLRGIILKRSDGKLRGLAVPTMQDRFLQRAVAEELAPAVEQLLEDSTFAYRRGLSRRSAEAAIRKAHDEGFRHVVDADIRSFFDEVAWDRLRLRLEAWFGNDPIVDVLMRWTQAPVQYAGQTIARSAGLPQGSVVSPFLANLYLDGFDESMARRGYRLVRYADDFVLLCRRPEEAQAALEATRKELADIGLQLAEQKTSISSFEQGFRFLGYLFCKTMVLEVGGARKHLGAVKVNEAEWLDSMTEDVDPAAMAGWLAEAQKLVPAEPEPARFRGPLQANSPQRKPVHIVSGDVQLSGAKRGLRVWQQGNLVHEVAWDHISEVAVLGGHRIAPSLFQYALRERIPVSLYTRSGEPVGMVLPHGVSSPTERALRQHQWAVPAGAALAAARSLVEAKIHNLRLLARRQPGDTEVLLARLDEASRAALRADSAERLRGIEGRAAHDWFHHWHGWLPEGFGFPGRSGRGAADPINAVLNLLYTQLFRACWLAALVAGLDPYLGVLHIGNRRYAALAADLQEPFRFLVDRLVLDLVRRHRLTPKDFVLREKYTPRLRIEQEAVKLILSEWERRLDAEVEVDDQRTTYRQHIRDQAARLAQLVDGERADLAAFRLKW
jgi:CRISPR-associated protein Cas1